MRKGNYCYRRREEYTAWSSEKHEKKMIAKKKYEKENKDEKR